MNFAEAWALLLEGKRIRRASWDRGFCLLILDGFVYEKSGKKGEPITFLDFVRQDELLATDWEEQ